jgi:hypothetical protein
MSAKRLTAAAALLAALLATVMAPAPAAARTFTVDEYAAAVGKGQAAVAAAGPSIDASGSAMALAETVRTAMTADYVEASDGRRFPVDPALPPLLDTLERADAGAATRPVPPDDHKARATALAALAGHLASLRSELGTSGPAAPSDPAALKDLLGQRAPGSATPGTDWLAGKLDEALRAISDWLSRVTGSGPSTSGGVGLVTYVVLAIPAVLALFILVRALVAWRRSTRPTGRLRARSAATGPVVEAAADLPDDPLAYAARLAGEGRRREATRALFGGAARRLVETGVLRRMRTRTDSELLRDVRRALPAAVPALTDLTDRFELAWYGHADPGDDGFEAARRAYVGVLEAAADREGGDGR